MARFAFTFRLRSGAVAGSQASVVDERLAKALSHPMRARILAILNDRVASPNEIAEMIDERLPNVSYHVRALLELECITLVSTAQRRGAIEHYYRAVKRPFFSDRDWKRLPRSARQSISDKTLQAIWADVSEAVRAGTFDSRPERHLSLDKVALDETGWTELAKAMQRLQKEASKIEDQSAKRLGKSDDDPLIRGRLVLAAFESPDDGS
jgi:DNA-binding transcriptional ArsR family regulator